MRFFVVAADSKAEGVFPSSPSNESIWEGVSPGADMQGLGQVAEKRLHCYSKKRAEFRHARLAWVLEALHLLSCCGRSFSAWCWFPFVAGGCRGRKLVFTLFPIIGTKRRSEDCFFLFALGLSCDNQGSSNFGRADAS